MMHTGTGEVFGEAEEDDILESLRTDVLSRVDPGRDTSEEEVRELIGEAVLRLKRERILPASRRAALSRRLFHELKGLDLLQDYLEDDSVTEIMVNNSQSPIFIERDGTLIETDRSFGSDERLINVAQRIVGRTNKLVNESSPIVDTRLPDGSRVNIVLAPTLLGGGAAITIRKFYKDSLSMEKMIRMGSITEEAADFLAALVSARYNIFISGGTGSGKTTFLNALSDFIPSGERVITIEDSAELQLKQVKNLVRLEARDKNLEGRGEIRISSLIRTALRMRPDRVIVGECRGEEAMDMLQAMQTGHDGSLSTGHANDSEDMCLRLESMILAGYDIPVAAIRRQIASAIDIMVHLERMRDGSRKVVSISEVVGTTPEAVILRRLYEYGITDGDSAQGIPCLHRTNQGLTRPEKLRKAGLDGGMGP